MFERLIIFCLQFMFPVMVIAVSTCKFCWLSFAQDSRPCCACYARACAGPSMFALSHQPTTANHGRPLCAVLCFAVIPIHLNSKYLADNTSSGQQFAKSNLMALTMGNLEPEAKTLWWVHRQLSLALGAHVDQWFPRPLFDFGSCASCLQPCSSCAVQHPLNCTVEAVHPCGHTVLRCAVLLCCAGSTLCLSSCSLLMACGSWTSITR